VWFLFCTEFRFFAANKANGIGLALINEIELIWKSWKTPPGSTDLAGVSLQKSIQNNRIKKIPKQTIQGVFLGNTYYRFIKIRGQPEEIALGLALGIFIGMLPIMGFQTGIAVFFAALFKWSKISAALGVWITNPLSAPLIYSITYVTGTWLLGVETSFNLQPEFGMTAVEKMLQKAPKVFGVLTIGGIVIGLPLGFISYYVSFSAILKYQRSIKGKLIRHKTKMKNTKERIKRKIRQRKKRQKD
jgi:uncharacterized protein (DUF2062 family)